MNGNGYGEKSVYIHNPNGTGKRIMFVGGSVTVHPPDAQLGFAGNYGMGASHENNDYVHVIMRYCDKVLPDCSFCLLQSRFWEEDYKNGAALLSSYREGRSFKADIIVMFVADHCERDGFDAAAFEKEYLNLLDYIDPDKKAHVLLVTALYPHPADAVIEKIADDTGAPCIYMGTLAFERALTGSAGCKNAYLNRFPNDRGMRKIAESMLCILEKYIRD